MYDEMIFGQRVRQHRRELDLTQEDFAQRVGIATETVSKIERGERRPSKHVAERMAQVLELPDAERAGFHADLRGLGYRVFKCGDVEYRGEELGPSDLSRWKHFDVFAVPEELA